MVDVGEKPVTHRVAVASGEIRMKPETMVLIQNREIQKGNVLEVARIAGVMASKKTSDIIPLCHPLILNSVSIEFFSVDNATIKVLCTVSANERTGVEMEALTSISAACLTVYDMCKSVDRAMVISNIQLDEKSGGKSGHFRRSDESSTANE